jgi:hypothetical protein
MESARVDANREFFDNFDEIVEDDAVWAYKFQREYNKKIKDPDDIYLEIKDSEERRRKKGLPPRLVILPDWDMSDEERYDEEQAKKRRRIGSKEQRTSKRRKSNHSKPSQRVTAHPQTQPAQTPENEAWVVSIPAAPTNIAGMHRDDVKETRFWALYSERLGWRRCRIPGFSWFSYVCRQGEFGMREQRNYSSDGSSILRSSSGHQVPGCWGQEETEAGRFHPGLGGELAEKSRHTIRGLFSPIAQCRLEGFFFRALPFPPLPYPIVVWIR